MTDRMPEGRSSPRINDVRGDSGSSVLPRSIRLENIGWSLVGLVVPMIAALVAVVPLLHALGGERFGLLALAWTVTAFSGVLDLGVGRATTRMVADAIGRGAWLQIPSIVATAVRLTSIFSAAGAVLFAGALVADAHLLVTFDRSMSAEVAAAAWMIVTVFPAQAGIATYRGASEALQRFRIVSAIRVVLGVASFGGPLIVAHATNYLPALVAPIAISRLVAWALYRHVLARQILNVPRSDRCWSTSIARELLRSSGWLTVSTSLSPLIAQADRFILGSLISATAVGTYALAFEIVMQPLVLVGAISAVAFPTLASMLAGGVAGSRVVFRKLLRAVGLVMAPVAAATAGALPFVNHLWPQLHLPSDLIVVGQVLSLGMWFNALGQIFLAYLHAHGRFRAVALLYVLEVPLYFLLLVPSILVYGVIGAATAWVIRALFDTVCLCVLALALDRLRVSSSAPNQSS